MIPFMKKTGFSLFLCLVGLCLSFESYWTVTNIQTAWAGSSELLSAGPLVSDLTPVLGINLSSVCYYSSELAFTDIFKQAQTWQEVWDETDGDAPGLLLDANGWGEALAPEQGAEALLCRVDGHYPAGVYTCGYDGEGELEFYFDAEVISREPSRIPLQVEPSAAGFALRLMNTSFSSPLRNIKIYLPGFTPADTSVFHPDFLENWKDFQAIRFMDWMRTNNSLQEFWEDLPVPDMQTQGSPRGVALEYMIQLANELKAHPWFCIPHKASAEYVLQFAERVKAELNPDLKVYVEYSNEVWNAQFDQAAYCQDLDLEFDLSQDPY